MAKKANQKTKAKAGKKTGKKAGKKAGKKSAEKASKKGAKKASTKKAKKADPLAPHPITTGKGSTPAEIGIDLVSMVNGGANEGTIWDKWFSSKFVSIEGEPMNLAWHGRKAAKSKVDWWYQTNKIHSLKAEGPYVGATGFGVKFTIDAEEVASGKRWQGDELAFYTVLKGKIIQEEFMGKPMTH